MVHSQFRSTQWNKELYLQVLHMLTLSLKLLKQFAKLCTDGKLRSSCPHQILTHSAQLTLVFVSWAIMQALWILLCKPIVSDFYLYLHKYCMRSQEVSVLRKIWIASHSWLSYTWGSDVHFPSTSLSLTYANLMNFRSYPPCQKCLWALVVTHKRKSVITHSRFPNA